MKTNTPLWSYLSPFFFEWENLGEKLERKSKRTFYVQ